MAWIEAHQSLRDHRKVLDMADRLDLAEPHVVGHLVYLWLWALDNAADGTLPSSARIVEKAAGWQGGAGLFVQAMIDAGMVNVQGDSWHIHDWDDYAGKLMDRRKSNAERQKAWRDRHKTDTEASGDDPVTVTSPSRNGATVPYRTVPNPTVPENGDLTVPPQAADAEPPTPIGKAVKRAKNGTDGEAYALVDAYAVAKGLKPSDVKDRQRAEAVGYFRGLVADVDRQDVAGCTAYLLTDPFWAEPGKLTARKVAETVADWIVQGRPTAMARAPANGAYRGRSGELSLGDLLADIRGEPR